MPANIIAPKKVMNVFGSEIAKIKKRLKKVQQLLINGVIEREGYNEMKTQHQTTLSGISKNQRET